MSGAPAAVRVVYIAGVQHCGSTMLDVILGNAPGARSLGEAAGFVRAWQGGPCDCGRPGPSCETCQAVVTAWPSGADAERALLRTLEMPLGGRCLHWTLLSTASRARYARAADAMFDAVAAESSAVQLIDSSKNVGRAAALLAASRHEIRLVHLVRDPRRYLESRARRATTRRERRPVLLTKWLGKNLLIAVLLRLRAGRKRYLLVRYEDLVTNPHAVLDRIGTFAGLEVEGLADRALTSGLPRQHLFEPARQVDYSSVRLDPSRAGAPRRRRG
jgi:hypothetical protein